jgi:two-component system, chemotaxis family, CheB/CheR fusion protein
MSAPFEPQRSAARRRNPSGPESLSSLPEGREDHRSRAYLAAIVESSQDAIVGEMLDGVVTSWNAGAHQMFGYSADEMLGRCSSMLVPSERLPELQGILAAARAGERVQHFETEGLCRDGRRIHLSLSVSPIEDPTGRVIGIAKIARDVTERRRAEQALRESEERFRLATEAVNGMVYDWDLRTGRVERSTGLKELVGYPPEEVEGELGWWKRQIHPDDAERVYGRIVPVLEAGGAAFSVEYRVCHRNGHYVHVWDKGLAVKDADGRVVRVVGSTVDISVRKHVEEELREAHREAQEASEAKDRFLATLSHELRTPLTPVLALISHLEEWERLAPEVREMLQAIRRNVELEAHLIDDLLDLTRVASGKLEIRARGIDARELLEQALEGSAPERAAKGLRLVAELAPGPHRIRADAPRLLQVFGNLLSNAAKFTPEGGEIRVGSGFEPSLSGEGEDLVVEITDTGIGIEPEVLPRIFQAFEQGDRRITRRFGGLGLGLAVSRAIVEQHGGSLTAASAGRGAGTTVTARLPLSGPPVDLDETIAPLPAPREGDAPARRRLHLLLVEDHRDTAEAMAALLGSSGYRVSVAGSVAAALEVAEEAVEAHPIDLVVSDLGLPDGSGHDLMRDLRRRWGLSGIVLSGYGMEEDVRHSREAGFARHLVKPVTLQTLKSAIEEVARQLEGDPETSSEPRP